MPRTKLQSAHLGGSPDEVEAAFYEALQQGDLERMMACWADEDDVVCVHPGGARLLGAAAIRASFEAMFAAGPVHAYPEQVRRVESMASAMHAVLERVRVPTDEGPRDALVLATNVYHKTAQGWRMVAHHASPGTPQDAASMVGVSQVLH